MPNTYDSSHDIFSLVAASATSPARLATLVTPSDTANLAPYAKALRVYAATGPATIRITPLRAADDDDTVTLTIVAGVTIEAIAARRVWSTGTSAGLVIHALAG